MGHRTAPEGHRVLICAPFGRDAESIRDLLQQKGYHAHAYPSLDDIASDMDDHAGVVLLTEEALRDSTLALRKLKQAQAPWSDVPFIVFISRQGSRINTVDSVRERISEFTGNSIILERPLSVSSLLSAIISAMRARQRQFELRDRLAENERQYHQLTALMENLPVGVAFIDADGATSVANPAFMQYRPDGSIPSRNAQSAAQWEGYDSGGNRLNPDQFPVARALRGEADTGTEYRYHPTDGAPLWTRVSATPLMDDDGRITGAVAVIVDIEAQKRAQKVLGNAAEELERQVAARTGDLQTALTRLQAEAVQREKLEASLRQSQKMEAVGQLTGGIAHDFNNMLTGVIGGMDIVKRRLASGRTDDLDRFMDAALISAQRAASLTARLLAFSRRQSLDARPLDVNKLLLSLEQLIRQTVRETITLDIAIGENVPFAVADENQLESAILNLSINARDAMPDGGTLTVESKVVDLDAAYAATHPDIEPGRYVVVSVIDTGVGMPPEVLQKVFDPFFTTKPIGQGTGLGLSMVYGFARQSGGQVRIKSTVGVGTRVSLYLRATEQSDTRTRETYQPAEADGGGLTVLLVEDDPSVRLLVREVLEELDYRTIEAEEANAAIVVLRSDQPIDLMVTDVGLPGMNGRQLAEIARQHRPDLPILFVTGYAENATMRADFLGNKMSMITKPFSIDLLAAKIREMLGD